ncbi:hypothetical protein CERSUDRAFT_113704 [Gelatoporia subvermispora B]|uniref:TEA domain-containing protein n=1 Tax=Ceriporiopsis subvermispora (strain B) TaxID=914234 RepID=M2QNB7_CERS8|nr:hypothetical protein CERSUDRAFT_113704 [Gelatoporia subvermispora B]
MGFDIMFRCSTAHYSLSSSSSLVLPSPAVPPKTMEPAYDALNNKASLTPQRKHHKLLKDGSEVWSDDVEKIFVDGLRKYWESPWATYSRGRSRWRNQFLVDHLKKHGIERSKKQVASHIQVLRNMWRGEPEFHLVAGGEELFLENGLLAPTAPKRKKSADRHDRASRPRLDSQDSYSSSSSASTPDFAALEFPAELSSPTSTHFASPPSIPFPDASLDDVATASLLSLPDAPFATITPASARCRAKSTGVKLEPLAMDPALFTLPQAPFTDLPDFPYGLQPSPQPNRICSISLWTDGMNPCVINVDQLASASLLTSPSSQQTPPFRILLRMNINILHTGIANTPASQGFRGTVTFAAPWMSMAKCHTKAWSGKTCIEYDANFFDQLSAQPSPFGFNFDHDASPPVVACLPESPLSRCSWTDTVQTITQQIVVDNEVLAVIIYNIERTADATRAPAVELVGFHKYPWRMQAAQPFPTPPVSPSSSFPASFEGPLSSQHAQPMMARSFGSAEDPLCSALSFNRGSASYDAGASNMYPSGLF